MNEVISAPVAPATSNSCSCSFEVYFDGSNPGSATAVKDIVHASGTDDQGNSWGGMNSTFEDDATVIVHLE